MQNKDITLPQDVKFELETLSFLKDKNGKLWHEKLEDSARYANATHTVCLTIGCVELAEYKGGICRSCSHKKKREKYISLPTTNSFPISLDGEEFFWDESDLESYCEDNEVKEEDLFLYGTEQKPFSELCSSYWDDETTEDGELPSEMFNLIDEFNQKLKTVKAYYFCDNKIRYKKEN